MTLIEYHIGMAKTAIGILNDLIYDYPSGVALNMVCHRRIHALDFKNCMYPMKMKLCAALNSRAIHLRKCCTFFVVYYIRFGFLI